RHDRRRRADRCRHHLRRRPDAQRPCARPRTRHQRVVIYLDEAATTPVKRAVLEAMWPYLGPDFGNPSSHHEAGESAQRALEQARTDVAQALGARSSEIIFTSGGTESDNAAIKGIALAAPRGRHVIVSGIEPPAVLESADWLGRFGYDITILEVDRDGMVGPDTLTSALREDT